MLKYIFSSRTAAQAKSRRDSRDALSCTPIIHQTVTIDVRACTIFFVLGFSIDRSEGSRAVTLDACCTTTQGESHEKRTSLRHRHGSLLHRLRHPGRLRQSRAAEPAGERRPAGGRRRRGGGRRGAGGGGGGRRRRAGGPRRPHF